MKKAALLTFLLGFSLLLSAAPADKTATADDEGGPGIIVRFHGYTEADIHHAVLGRVKADGTRDSRDQKIAVFKLTLTDPYGQNPGTYTAFNKGEMTKTIKACKDGDYLKVTRKKSDPTWVLSAIPYKLKEGEDGPNSYIFKKLEKKTIEGCQRIGVLADRFGQAGIVWVPLVRRDGKDVNDEELAKRVATFADDDVVELTVTQSEGLPVLASAYKWQAARPILFQELTRTTVGQTSYDAVLAKDGTSDVTLLVARFEDVPGHFASNRQVMSALRSARKGTVVYCKTYQEPDGTLIREAVVTDKTELPPQAASAPADTAPKKAKATKNAAPGKQ